MGRAHKLKLDHGQYCGSILGLVLSYMQPTMNPCGYLVVKQAEILEGTFFPGSNACLLIRLGCLAWFLFSVLCEEVRNIPRLHFIL